MSAVPAGVGVEGATAGLGVVVMKGKLRREGEPAEPDAKCPINLPAHCSNSWRDSDLR